MKLTIHFIVTDDFKNLKTALSTLYENTRTAMSVCVTINNPQAISKNQSTHSQTKQHMSMDELRAEFPDVRFHLNEEPKGFAANHNQALRKSSSEYVGLLNDDVIIHESAIDHMVAHLDQHPNVGLVGAKLFNPDGSYQVSMYSDPSLTRMLYKISGVASLTHSNSLQRRLIIKLLRKTGINEWLNIASLTVPNKNQSVDIVTGVCMIVRRSAYEQVGGMDETTLAYGEEPDWHYRLRQHGWLVDLVADAHITHLGQSQASLRIAPSLLAEDRKAIMNYFTKHRPANEVVIIRCGIVLSHLFWSMAWFLFNFERSRNHLKIAQLGLRWQRQQEVAY